MTNATGSVGFSTCMATVPTALCRKDWSDYVLASLLSYLMREHLESSRLTQKRQSLKKQEEPYLQRSCSRVPASPTHLTRLASLVGGPAWLLGQYVQDYSSLMPWMMGLFNTHWLDLTQSENYLSHCNSILMCSCVYAS